MYHYSKLNAMVVYIGLVETARILIDDGIEVFPYTTDDLIVGERLLNAGCQVLMPWRAQRRAGRSQSVTFQRRARPFR